MKYNSENSMQPFRKNVSCMFVIYWAVLVGWQNISGAEARTAMDIVIKIGLLAYFVWFYIRNSHKVSVKIIWVLLLTASLLVSAGGESRFTLSSVISYAYPVVFLTMVYGFGDHMEISRLHLITFCKCVITITMYAAVYAVIFCWDQFANAFSISKAYGNELTSFFISSHEYGMYLVSAIASCGICLRLEHNSTRKRRAYYIVAIVFLTVNLILTFSRTSLLGLAVFLLVYVLFGKGKLKRGILYLTLIATAVVFLTPSLRDYLFDIVLKANTLSGRDDLLQGGISLYSSGNVFEKLFGFGIYETQRYFEWGFDHGSAHNAYLQILLSYGALGAMFLVSFMISQVVITLRFVRTDRFLGALHLGLVLMAAAMMFTNTAIVFTSPIDSFFMTIFMFIVPKYVRNAVRLDRFW